MLLNNNMPECFKNVNYKYNTFTSESANPKNFKDIKRKSLKTKKSYNPVPLQNLNIKNIVQKLQFDEIQRDVKQKKAQLYHVIMGQLSVLDNERLKNIKLKGDLKRMENLSGASGSMDNTLNFLNKQDEDLTRKINQGLELSTDIESIHSSVSGMPLSETDSLSFSGLSESELSQLSESERIERFSFLDRVLDSLISESVEEQVLREMEEIERLEVEKQPAQVEEQAGPSTVQPMKLEGDELTTEKGNLLGGKQLIQKITQLLEKNIDEKVILDKFFEIFNSKKRPPPVEFKTKIESLTDVIEGKAKFKGGKAFIPTEKEKKIAEKIIKEFEKIRDKRR